MQNKPGLSTELGWVRILTVLKEPMRVKGH